MDGNVKCVRNFWIEVEIDGQKTTLKGGPKSKDGGAKITIYQRNGGGIIKPFVIECTEDDGALTTTIENTTYGSGTYITEEVTTR